MRNLALSILITLFALPAFAEELVCNNTPAANPAPVFIEWVTEHHPQLTEDQVIIIAQAFEAADHQLQLVNNEDLSEADRTFADRTSGLILDIAATQMVAFENLPKIQLVLERMNAEKAAGLKRVSPELEPDVRHSAYMILILSQKMGELVNEGIQLQNDRLMTVPESSNFKEKIDAINRTICVVKVGWPVMEGAVDLIPSVIPLAYVKHLNY